MTPLLYANNADIKYPLSDFHEFDIPNDILLDISLNIPDGYDPIISCIRVTKSFTFISIEDRSSGLPIAHLMANGPIPARVYALNMDVPGTGWAVLGPAVGTEIFYIGGVEIDLDPETYVSIKETGLAISLTTNSFDGAVSDFLEIVSSTDFLEVTESGSTIFIDRDDSVLTRDQLVGLKIGQTSFQSSADNIIYTVGGTAPDSSGNIDIVISGDVSDCGDFGELDVPRGDEGVGEYKELPLDIFNPKYYAQGDDCAPSSYPSNVPEETDDFEGSTAITGVPIIDITNNRTIGTVYTSTGALN